MSYFSVSVRGENMSAELDNYGKPATSDPLNINDDRHRSSERLVWLSVGKCLAMRSTKRDQCVPQTDAE